MCIHRLATPQAHGLPLGLRHALRDVRRELLQVRLLCAALHLPDLEELRLAQEGQNRGVAQERVAPVDTRFVGRRRLRRDLAGAGDVHGRGRPGEGRFDPALVAGVDGRHEAIEARAEDGLEERLEGLGLEADLGHDFVALPPHNVALRAERHGRLALGAEVGEHGLTARGYEQGCPVVVEPLELVRGVRASGLDELEHVLPHRGDQRVVEAEEEVLRNLGNLLSRCIALRLRVSVQLGVDGGDVEVAEVELHQHRGHLTVVHQGRHQPVGAKGTVPAILQRVHHVLRVFLVLDERVAEVGGQTPETAAGPTVGGTLHQHWVLHRRTAQLADEGDRKRSECRLFRGDLALKLRPCRVENRGDRGPRYAMYQHSATDVHHHVVVERFWLFNCIFVIETDRQVGFPGEVLGQARLLSDEDLQV
ncbi:DsbA family protein [Babesia caballi]|uniref:DsbA family protein n=1 Tax=Babesia caballi TaxID=5871 RepID=A0AAV4LUJ8_BABCB|nr:DsbA family protein [Babesia caballi]